MQIMSERLGTLDIPDDALISFPHGIPAFETVRQFTVVRNERTAPFAWLQAADRPELSFLLLKPWDFCGDYDLDISDGDCRELGLTAPEEADIYAILAVRTGSAEMTANLLAPLVINPRLRRGMQVINNIKGYTTRHNVMTEMRRSQATAQPPLPGRQQAQQVRPAATAAR